MIHRLLATFLVVAMCFAAACGGSDDSSDSSTTGTAPTLTTQPASQSVAAGASVTFSAAASGDSPLAFQWRKSGTAISGATAESFSIASVTASDAGDYDVVVSNAAGSATSAIAVLTVTSATGGSLSADVTAAAQAFLATLSSTQQSAIQLAFSVDTARRWSNLPASFVTRNGIGWGGLSSAQKTAARTLIQTALGVTGAQLQFDMQAADNDLVSSFGANSSEYGEDHYFIAFLGTPSATSMWMLQLSGHHLTYNLALNANFLSPTPVFLGVEPNSAFTVNGASVDPMLAQRTAMEQLAAALGSYPEALLSGTFDDILFGANGQGGIDGEMPKDYPTGATGRGVLYGSLSTADQAKARAVIQSYVATQADEVASELLEAYLSDSALAETYVAYGSGTSISTRGNYFRVDGPRVWIEWSVQNGILVRNDIHPHTVWRDKSADYGG